MFICIHCLESAKLLWNHYLFLGCKKFVNIYPSSATEEQQTSFALSEAPLISASFIYIFTKFLVKWIKEQHVIHEEIERFYQQVADVCTLLY